MPIIEGANPLKLPKRYDFHDATKDLPLPRSTISRFQVKLSKMTKDQVKDTIKELEAMREAKLVEARMAGYKGPLVVPKEIADPEKKKAMQMAIWCESVRQFVEKYLISLEAQGKI